MGRLSPRRREPGRRWLVARLLRLSVSGAVGGCRRVPLRPRTDDASVLPSAVSVTSGEIEAVAPLVSRRATPRGRCGLRAHRSGGRRRGRVVRGQRVADGFVQRGRVVVLVPVPGNVGPGLHVQVSQRRRAEVAGAPLQPQEVGRPLDRCGRKEIRPIQRYDCDASHVRSGIERRVAWRLATVIV